MKYFSVVEISAEPECGIQGFYKTVSDLMKYPAKAREMGIEGSVFVEFIINKDGTFSDVRIIKGIGAKCDVEAVRVFQESSKRCKWLPGMQMGKPVRQRYTLPIIFKI